MDDKFRNRYRISSARIQKWDYAWSGSYFITICTHHRISYFGDVIKGKMELSEIGKIVQQEWVKTFEMRPDMNLQKGVFVVMPNHFHGIIIIGKNQYNVPIINEGVESSESTMSKNQFGPQSKNLPSVVRGFKTGVTKRARIINAGFKWQSGYYDNIIRNEKSFHRISTYIENNPLQWNDDVFRW